MEKIIVTCAEGYLSYEFPKRKWYQPPWQERMAKMRLAAQKEEALEEDILLRIQEKGEEAFSYQLHPFYKKAMFKAILANCRREWGNSEHGILLDYGEPVLAELAYEFAKDKNYFTIYTQDPLAYEAALKRMEEEYGLVGMVFTEEKELVRYLKQCSKERKVSVLAGREMELSEGKRKYTTLLYQLPKKSCLIDFTPEEAFAGRILRKRMDFTYMSIPIFLDNTVKNRYNSVVNEGITFQVINKKTVWRRKGSKDGRKEEYSDL